MRIAAAIWATVVAMTAPAAERDSVLLVELGHAQRLWESKALVDYSYTLIRGGVFGGAIYEVRVRSESCTARTRDYFGKPHGPWRSVSCKGLTIPELFDDVRIALDQDNLRAEAKFNETYGYVSSFSVEPNTDISDTGWGFNLSEFHAADSAPNNALERARGR